MSRKATSPRASESPARGTVWVVTDATPASSISDCCFEVEADGFIRQVRGGLSEDSHPRFHSDKAVAMVDAVARILAARAREAIARAPNPRDFVETDRLELRRS